MVSLPMTWKSTALLSGAGLLATWFASVPPPGKPTAPVPARTADPAVSSRAATDIVAEAARLRARLESTPSFQHPSRDPFRFGERAERPAPAPAPVVPPPPVVDLPPSPSVRMVLSGVAENLTNGVLVRTAIISTPQDVLLVKEGEMVSSTYRVALVTADAVELTKLDDGSVVRLTLKP